MDDPYDYGQIAAANSISDIYAMGGRPLFALNIVCFPSKQLPLDVLGEILKGGNDKAREAEIEIVGGHSVDDAEPKYGLVVTGIVPQGRVLTNAGAQPGDVLVLTKPLGSGILTTALKQGKLSDTARQQVVEVMATLNRAASRALEGLQVHALTDITGFGLLGHLIEMAEAAQLTARISASAVPVLEQAWPLAREGIFPGGATRNRQRVESKIQWSASVAEEARVVLTDPQTSGGLLIAIAESDVAQLFDRLAENGVRSANVVGNMAQRAETMIEILP